MAKSFAITTTATDVLRADAKGHAEAGFTVTNTTTRPIRGLARAKPLGDTKHEWLRVQGEAERDFAAGATQQFTVRFDGPAIEPPSATGSSTAPPSGTPPTPAGRKYPFRLDVESALNPDENFTEGPTVTVEMLSAPVSPKKKFPLWIIFVILGVLLLVGIIILVVVLTRDGKSDSAQATGGESNTNQGGAIPKPNTTRPQISFSPAKSAPFEGNWINTDPNTKGATRLVITQNADQLSVHIFVKCPQKDCDYGTHEGSVSGNEGHVTFELIGNKVKMLLKRQGELLEATTDSFDENGKLAMHIDHILKKQ